MSAYVAISILDSHPDISETINRILKQPVKRHVYVYDLTINGVDSEIKRFIKSYNKYGVFLHRVKNAAKFRNRNERLNIGIAESIMHYQLCKNKYDVYVHLYQNIIFNGFDLQLLIGNARLYNMISPVIESYKCVEVIDGVFDRFGAEYLNLNKNSIHFITGQIEESHALNPKCFAMTRRLISRLDNFMYSNEDPVKYLNSIVQNYISDMPTVDTNMFVHEHLY